MSESSNREEAIFAAASELPAAQRAEYVRQACGDDHQLYERVMALLQSHVQASGFLEAPAVQSPRPTIVLSIPLTEKAGDLIGRYKLLQQIGEGGCGVVYVAEQEEPVRRRVAVKVIKLGMDTKSVIARFEAERQALAMMDHPNIARVLDAGASETGRPYFVMELVRGIKITEYCDQNKLPTDDRLKLFVQVCHAIQHAHQKGIIHRDIKPSNILLTLHDGVPVPKVIDFGIAKATQGRLTDKTVYTAFEQFIGTPAYMSPEQAEMSGLDVDTRSDIYALGVLLYELLTGRTPFDAKELLQSGLDELRRTIREREPARPSTRLNTMLEADLTEVAHRRQSEAPKLVHALRGDLDWIVMKTLEKDRTRRYETATALAEDIQRYLGDEPVSARPPSTLYRFQKLVRRNKTMFIAAGAGMAALVIGLVFSLYLYTQEKSALKRAVAAEQVEKQLREQAELSSAVSQQSSRAGLLLMSARYDESEQMLRGLAPRAVWVPFYNVFGGLHARRGEWNVALTNWNWVVQYAPDDHLGYTYLAPLLLQMDDVEGYQHCRSVMLQKFGNTTDPRAAERMVKACLILPATSEQLATITVMADVAFQAATNTDANSELRGYYLFAKGFTEYRRGNYVRAAELLQQVISCDVGQHRRTEAYLVLAMAQSQLNQMKESHDSYAQALEAVNRRLPKAGDLDENWNDWIAIHMLLREAGTFLPAVTTDPAAVPAWQTTLRQAGINFKVEQQSDGTWELELDNQPVADLTSLHGAPISNLSLMRTRVSDLSPLQGMPLRRLKLADTKVTDLRPLAGMQLNSLQLSGTPVTDITPIRGMPLRTLNMTSCMGITNISALAGMNQLEAVILPPNAQDIGFLRTMTNLTRIGYKYSPINGPDQSAAEFWAAYDQANAGKAAPAQP